MKMPSKEFFGQLTFSMFGGGMLGPIGLAELMNYGGNNGCFAWADALYGVPGYESCMQLGLHGGVLIGSLIGFLIWQYSSSVRNIFLGMKWFTVAGVYILGICIWLLYSFFGMIFSGDPETLLYLAMASTLFIFASVLSIIPFLICKGIQKLFVKK